MMFFVHFSHPYLPAILHFRYQAILMRLLDTKSNHEELGAESLAVNHLGREGWSLPPTIMEVKNEPIVKEASYSGNRLNQIYRD